MLRYSGGETPPATPIVVTKLVHVWVWVKIGTPVLVEWDAYVRPESTERPKSGLIHGSSDQCKQYMGNTPLI